jgi:hypothetical protein
VGPPHVTQRSHRDGGESGRRQLLVLQAQGFLEQVPGSKDRLALVRIAVYAIRPEQVAEMRLDDLNRSTGLDEARETADPVRLMCLFGITSHTAIHYVRAARPEYFTIGPTRP